MPPYRNEPRRSRRLSKQIPKTYDGDGYEMYDAKSFDPRCSSESTTSNPPHNPSPLPETPSTPSSYDEQSPPPPSKSKSKARKHDEDHIPRPPNAFMLYRSHYWSLRKNSSLERDHRQISRMVGAIWKGLPEREKVQWKKLANIRKAEHAAMYPQYKYTPSSRRKEETKKKKAQKEVARCKQIAKCVMKGQSFEGLETFSPEPTPSPSDLASLSSVQVKEESPRISLHSLPVCDESVSPVSVSQYQAAPGPGQSFGGSALLGSFEAEDNLGLHEFGLIKIKDGLEYSEAFVPTHDIPPLVLPAPAVVLPALGAVQVVKAQPQFASPSPRTGSPALPANREIDSQFGYRPQIYNLEPQQMIYTAPSGYTEVSSFAHYDYYGQCTPGSDDFMASTSYEHFHFGYDEVAGMIINPYPSYPPSVGYGLNEGFLNELAESNPSYRFD